MISAPSNFNHITHMGPGDGIQIQRLMDLPTTLETADQLPAAGPAAVPATASMPVQRVKSMFQQSTGKLGTGPPRLPSHPPPPQRSISQSEVKNSVSLPPFPSTTLLEFSSEDSSTPSGDSSMELTGQISNSSQKIWTGAKKRSSVSPRTDRRFFHLVSRRGSDKSQLLSARDTENVWRIDPPLAPLVQRRAVSVDPDMRLLPNVDKKRDKYKIPNKFNFDDMRLASSSDDSLKQEPNYRSKDRQHTYCGTLNRKSSSASSIALGWIGMEKESEDFDQLL